MAQGQGDNFSAENVERNVIAFYGGRSASLESDAWLTKAQSSPDAWQFAWVLLNPSKNAEVQFFGANTIVTKVKRHLISEVPAVHFDSLRKKRK